MFYFKMLYLCLPKCFPLWFSCTLCHPNSNPLRVRVRIPFACAKNRFHAGGKVNTLTWASACVVTHYVTFIMQHSTSRLCPDMSRHNM